MVVRMLLAASLMFGAGLQAAVASGNSCHQFGLDGKAAGICNAYLFANTCTAQSDKKSCAVLEGQFLKETGYSIKRLVAFQGVEETLSVNGGKVSLPSVAAISFSKGDLSSNTLISMRMTNDASFREYMLDAQEELGGDYESLGVELRVSLSGSVPQGETLPVTLSLSQEIWGVDTGSEEFLVLIAQQQGSDQDQFISSLVVADSSSASATGSVSFEMPANAFFQHEQLTLIGEEAIIYILKKGNK